MQAVSLRNAERADCVDLWNWRNDPHTRLMSANRNEVSWREHEAWFERSLTLPTRSIWIAESGIEKCGMVRFDRVDDNPKAWEISIAINTRFRGRGLGARVLTLACAIFEERQRMSTLRAKVRHGNIASLRIFERCGFSRSAMDCNYVVFQRPSTE